MPSLRYRSRIARIIVDCSNSGSAVSMRPCAEWLAMTARQKDGEHESAGLLNDFVLTKTSALPCKVAHDLVHTLERTGGCPARASVDSSLLLRSDGGRLRRTDRLCDDQRIVGFVGRLVRAGVERPFA